MADSVTALEPLLLKWLAKVQPVVKARVHDARDHAANARTETLKRTPDGRSSLLRINAHPSYLAALKRLDELWTWLAGPSEVSLDGAIRDAREALYRKAAEYHYPTIPSEYRARNKPEPTNAMVRAIRAAAVHGYDPRKVLETPVRRAKLSLKAQLELAARKGSNKADGIDRLAGWEASTAGAIGTVARTLLTDSLVYADAQAFRDLIKPELVEE